MRVLVADPLAAEGVELLRKNGLTVEVKTGLPAAEIEALIPRFEALIVRSETKVTEPILKAGKLLQVVGRAGVGVDNIDVEAASRQGILVVNAPTANILAAAEHTVALMLALARHIPQADRSMKAGKWDRRSYMGTQMRGKTLGIIGLGRVGTEVASRAKAFDMRVIAVDPYVTGERAKSLGITMVSKEELLAQADFLTLHVPLTSQTKSLITKADLAVIKKGVRILNTARGGIVDEQALYDAVTEGRVAGAAVDVFSVEPVTENILTKSEKIIVTPHLGASTAEAQAQASVEIAEQVLDVLNGRPARYVVNAPMLQPEAQALLSPFAGVGAVIGKMATQLCQGQVQSVSIKYAGEIAAVNTAFLKAAVLRGLLAPISDERVNVVNADLVATQRGIKIAEEKEKTAETYRNTLAVTVATSAGPVTVGGTQSFGRTHIIQINDYQMDVAVTPDSWMLIIENQDRPGMIGAVGTIAGEADVNISFMEVGRVNKRGRAVMSVGLDEPMPEAALKKLSAVGGILSIRQVQL